jgi:hypothetical protein
MQEGLIRWGALAYTANFAAGVLAAIRGNWRAEPLGIRTRLPVALDAMIGNGTALSAPPALIVLLWRLLNRPNSRKTNGHLVLLTATFLAGAVAEPLSHRLFRHGLPFHVRVVAVLNILLPAAMLLGATSSLIERNAAE